MFHLDYETFSEADLPNVGSFRYAYDPSTEILCAAIAKGDGAPRIWVAPQHRYPGCPHDPASEALLMEMLVSDEPVYAHNVLFELPITEAIGPFHSGIDRKRWRCTAAMARRAGLPHALGKLAEKLGLEQQKDRSGAALIRKFSLLQKDGSRILPKDDPEAFKKFCDYCVQDVRTEQAVHKKLAAFELKGFPLEVFQTDLEINARGLPVNLDAIGKAKTIVEDAAATTREAFKQLTGLEPTQGVAFLDWLKERGYEHEDLRADTIEEFLDSDECDLDGEVGQALSLRRLVSFAATKKLNSFEAFAGPHDNRVRGILMYYGAIRTGRWSSSGPQIQNAKKPPKHLEAHTDAIYRDICRGASVEEINFNYGNPIECVASCIRHFVQDDRPMLNADYSAIEARVLAWLAGEKWRLKLFTEGGDIYVASIAEMLNISREQARPLRQKGKVVELLGGYGGGVNAYIRMGALKMGLTEEEIPDLVQKWRAANPNIKAFWSKCEFAAKQAISYPGQRYGVNNKLEFFCARTAGMNYLFLKLPSGRHLAYPEPKLEKTNSSWGEVIDSITFYGQIPMKKTTWTRLSTWGSKIAENVAQAVSADVMAQGAVNCEKAGYEINALIHDEALAYHKPGQTPEEFSRLLTTVPDWAKGLPLAAPGGLVNYYRKD
jgi:DNA polymerase